MRFEKIIQSLNAVATTRFMPDTEEIKWACATDLMSEVLYYSRDNSVLITGLAKQQAIRTADIADIRVVIFTQGKEPDTPTVELAKEKRITLLITPYSMFSACGRLYQEGLRCCQK